MIQCPNCGAELSDDAKFCSYCGVKIETASQPKGKEATVPPIISVEPSNEDPKDAPSAPEKDVQKMREMADEAVDRVHLVKKTKSVVGQKRSKAAGKNRKGLGTVLVVLFLLILIAAVGETSDEETADSSPSLAASSSIGAVVSSDASNSVDVAVSSTASSAVSSKSVVVSVEDTDSQPERNGFDSASNDVYELAQYRIEIPSYWDSATENRIDGGIQRYAETGGKVVMLQITAGEDSDVDYPVTFDGLITDNDNMIASLEKTVFNQVTGYEVIDTGVVKGILYKGTVEESGVTGYGKWFIFPSEADRNWCNIVLVQSNNTDYSYTEDFLKIINSIRPIEKNMSAAKQPESELESAPYTTIENSSDFAALMKITDQTDAETIKQYVNTHIGTVVEFDGCVILMMHHADYKTRFDVALLNGDYDGSRVYGPIFAFEDVNFYDMNVSGTDIVAEEMNFRIAGEIKGFNDEGCYVVLDPVSMIAR